MSGHFFYVVKLETVEVDGSAANYSCYDYILKCRNEHSGEENVELQAHLASSKSYNDMDMFLTV
jgi:hypothetical protein